MKRLQPARSVQGRTCGTCTLCCKAVPVGTLQKPRDVWCSYCRKGKGCTIYDDRPEECRQWSCLWLLDADLSDDMKPERSRVIFDPVVVPVGVNGRDRDGIQVWIDAGYPLAWRTPAAMKQIFRYIREYRSVVIVRLGYDAAVVDERGVTSVRLAPDDTWDETDAWQVADYYRRRGR